MIHRFRLTISIKLSIVSLTFWQVWSISAAWRPVFQPDMYFSENSRRRTCDSPSDTSWAWKSYVAPADAPRPLCVAVGAAFGAAFGFCCAAILELEASIRESGSSQWLARRRSIDWFPAISKRPPPVPFWRALTGVCRHSESVAQFQEYSKTLNPANFHLCFVNV